jgi:beta-lactam-binding protein with PASTA domain
MAAVGQVLNGRYRLVELLGEGGMATVYRAHDTQLGRDVAVKVLRADYGRDPAFVTRFRQEAQSAAALNHPNVVNVYDYGMENGDPFIVMELVEGGDLAQILRERGSLDPVAAARVAQQMADALDVAHGRGIVHRDIKTTNVMITRAGRVKVGDFGIARAFSEAQITLPGTTLGSVHYFSPEQARGELVTSASDVYSLGLVLFEMLTGQRAWTGDSTGAVAVARLAGDPPLPSSLNPEVPPALDAIVMAALARQPSDRPTAGQLSHALARFIADPNAPVNLGAALAPPPVPVSAAATAATLSPPAASAQPAYGTYAGTYKGRRLTRPMAQRPDDDEGEDEGAGPWAWVAAVLGVLVLIVGGVLVYLVLSGRGGGGTGLPTPTSGLVEVPNFVGLQYADARTQAQAASLILTIGGSRVMTDGTPENQVVAQDRAVGDRVAAGSEISVTVATHSDTVAVPDLTNRTEAELVAILLSAGLTPGTRTTDYSPDVLATNVIGTEPRAGINVAPGTVVDYVISLGPPPTPSPTESPSPTPSPTLPPTPTPLPTDSPTPFVTFIIITPSPGPSPTPTPTPVTVHFYADCGPLSTAEENIVNDGLTVGVIFPTQAGLDWQVAQQYPAPGDLVAPGTEVSLYVLDPTADCSPPT